MKRLALCLTLIAFMGTANCQSTQPNYTKVFLNDMSAFKGQAGNWQIVGDVLMDPNVSIHEQPVVPVSSKKKNRRTIKDAAVPAVTFKPGKGILLNMNNDLKKDHLVSAFVHGDIELELEFMLPRGSNSGIYLQGRYEIQLLDSWGIKNPKYSDVGGIYRNFETHPDKIYLGKAPNSNPSKAPGLWQKMRIVFRAPRFDSSGNKTENAKFVSVQLNGVIIHENVEIPLPTGGALEDNEAAFGPLLIQGDHGSVAFRNISYMLMKEIEISTSDIQYHAYKGSFSGFADFEKAKPVKSGVSSEVTVEVLHDRDAYGLVFRGNLTVPQDDTYEFQLAFTGGVKLVVNNQTLLELPQGDARGLERAFVALKSGTYPFKIYNFKASWMPPRLGFYVRTPSSYPETLSAYNSFPPDANRTSPILVKVGSEPKLLRAFLDFKGDRNKRLTHTVGVGDPGGINYVYDLNNGNIVCVWRGDFVDATPMWHERGDGSFLPQGAVQYLFNNQPIAFLSSETDPFPEISEETEYRSKGYKLEEGTGRPIFYYSYQGLQVEDKILPVEDNRTLRHELRIKNRGTRTALFYKLAEGSDITVMPNGSYAIDDKQYYVKAASHVFVREVQGKKELVMKIDGESINYSITW